MTPEQEAWIRSNVANRIVTVEMPAYGSLEAVYISNEGWMPESGPLYDGRILRPWTLKRSVGGALVGGGRTVIGLGTIEVANADGHLGWMDQNWHNRPVTIRWGDPSWMDIDDHIVIHKGFVDKLQSDGLSITIHLVDARERFAVVYPRARYSANTDLPTGSVTDGLGEIKPMAQGNAISADTVLLQEANLYFGVAHSEIENRFQFSQELWRDEWVKTNAQITQDAIEAPDGSMADLWESTGATSSIIQTEATSDSLTVWALVRAASGTVDVTIVNSDNSAAITVSDEWQVISYNSKDKTNDDRGLAITSQIGAQLYVARMQVNSGSEVKPYTRTAEHPITLPAIVKLRDNGVELTEGSVPTNDWEVVAPGIVQLDNVTGRLTADTEAGSGKAADVFVRMLNEVGLINFDPVSTLSLPNVEVSLWSDDSKPAIDYMDQIVNSVGSVWYPDRSGTVVVEKLDIPQSPTWTFDQSDIQGYISADLVTLPIESIAVSVRQSWTEIDRGTLDGTTLSQGEIQLLSEQDAGVVASKEAELEANETAPEELETFETLLRLKPDARELGARWQQMLSVLRKAHRAKLLRGAGLIDLASTVRIEHDDVAAYAGLTDENGDLIVDENGYAIERGVDLVVLSLDESFPDGSVTVEGWA